ncbi:Antitoxin [compost metagenome]
MKYSVKITSSENGYKKIKLPEEILAVEYLLYDMESFRSPVLLSYIEKVLNKESELEEIGGNICSLEIMKDKTKVINNFVNEGMQVECEIETIELKALIELWIEENKDILN